MKMGRREFLKATLAGTGGMLLAGGRPVGAAAEETWDPYELVPLGKTKVRFSRTGFGTGMLGRNRQSNQTRLGREVFGKLLRDAYDRGVRYFDMADMYGSHPFVGEALAKHPRESYALQSKLWVAGGKYLSEDEHKDLSLAVKRFLKEIKTDYIDSILLHCMTDAKWPEKFRRHMDTLEALKERGLILAHGVSLHSLAALETAVAEPWVDTMNVRLNAYGVNMDDKDPAKVAELVRKAHEAGKGVVAMKLIGEGKFRDSDEKRDESVRFVLGLKAVDAMAVGFEKIEEVDDFAARVKKVVKT